MSSRSASYVWSPWEWNDSRGKYRRWRYNSKNKLVWESTSREPDSTPRQSELNTASSIGTFSSSTADNDPQYYDSAVYQYDASTSSSDAFAGLVDEMATTSLTEQPGPALQLAYPAENTTGYNLETPTSYGFQQPPQYASSSSVYYGPSSSSQGSMYSTGGRMTNYPAPSTGYDTRNYYNPPIAEEEDGDYGDEDPYGKQRDNRRRGSSSKSSALAGSYSSEATITQAKSRSREPPPPLELPSEFSKSRKATHPKISGTGGDYEPLDPEFKVEHSKKFKPGHVFKVVWSEPRGESRSETGRTNVTVEELSTQGAYGQPIYSSVRRFVIVATGKGFSNCVPILTYGHQGYGKPGIESSYHAIVYSSEQPPALSFTPELSMIHFEGKNTRHKLDEYSLINYAKIYPVEHNVKVQFIGWIAKDSQGDFMDAFDSVWSTHKHMRR